MSQTKCSECFDHEVGVYCNPTSCPFLFQNKVDDRRLEDLPKDPDSCPPYSGLVWIEDDDGFPVGTTYDLY